MEELVSPVTHQKNVPNWRRRVSITTRETLWKSCSLFTLSIERRVDECTILRYLHKMGSLSNCRFYENQFPAIDELVVVQVRQIAEMGAYVKLLEYDNIEGMILLSELSRRRIRSINKLIRVGRNEVVVVLRVDQEKGQ